MAMATLTNVDRAEYGTITVDTGLLEKQIKKLATTMPDCDEKEGILNLLGGIMDIAEDN